MLHRNGRPGLFELEPKLTMQLRLGVNISYFYYKLTFYWYKWVNFWDQSQSEKSYLIARAESN